MKVEKVSGDDLQVSEGPAGGGWKECPSPSAGQLRTSLPRH